MGSLRALSRVAAAAAITVSGLASGVAWSQVAAEPQTRQWSESVWAAALDGSREETLLALDRIPEGVDPDNVTNIRSAIDLLRANFEKQQTEREKQIAEQRTELTRLLEESKENDPAKLSEAMAVVLFLDSIVLDRAALLQELEIRDLIERSSSTAAKAEDSQDWLTAMELYARLNLIEEASQRFKADVERQLVRREMLTLYVPERYWNLRDAKLREIGEEGLPPYNPRGDDFRQKLSGVTSELVMAAVAQGARNHISAVPLKDMAAGGLEMLEMLAEMGDLSEAFPKLGDDGARQAFEDHLRMERANLAAAGRDISIVDLRRTLNRLLDVNAQTVNLPGEVVLHEFGAGAMGKLDEFSQIVWPHELLTFYKRLDSSFIGVGVQIVNDPVTGDLQVFTPIPGMPAMRAGVRAGDIIAKVDGEPTVGMTTDQAVDVITGPKGTKVTLTIKREDESGEVIEKEITIVRDEIEIATVSGWKKLSPAPDDWDWYVDRDQRIGYVRLDKFAQESSDELDAAIEAMRRDGLNGLILDLRFNSGGQLNQAIEISNRFIENGTLVSTVNSRTEPPRSHTANKWKASLAGVPVVVLVNSNSASASEIVAGALKDYGNSGEIRAIVLGERTYGKGTVQNLNRVSANAAMKVTTQYYQLPSGQVIHRQAGDPNWGVNPDLAVPLLPSQVNEWLLLRRDADVFQIDEFGQALEYKPRAPAAGEEGVETEVAARPDPQDLIEKGIDLQLQAAVVLLKSQAPMNTSGTAMIGG